MNSVRAFVLEQIDEHYVGTLFGNKSMNKSMILCCNKSANGMLLLCVSIAECVCGFFENIDEYCVDSFTLIMNHSNESLLYAFVVKSEFNFCKCWTFCIGRH